MKKILALIMFLALSLSVFVACETTSPAEKTAKENAQIELESAADYLYQLYKDTTVTAVSYDLHKQVAIEGVVYPITWSIEVAEENAEKVTLDTTGAKPQVVLDTFTDSPVEYVLVATFSLDIQVKDKTITVSYEKKFPRTLPAFQYATFDDYVAAANNTNLFVKGYVTGIISKSVNATNNCIYVDDMSGNGGYYVYGLSEDPAGIVSIGDVVMVNGDKDLYNGTHELKNATVTVLEEPAVDVVAKDFTSVYASATALDDAALVGPQAQLVKICGVTITSQGDNGYYHFKLGELESYLRISSSTNALTAAETDAFKALHTASYGMLADVEGVISIYNGKFYLAPVSANAISNIRMPERSDAEKVAFELESLEVVESLSEDTALNLAAVGALYSEVLFSWSLDAEYDFASITDGVLNVTLPEEATTITLNVTLTLGEITADASYEILVYASRIDWRSATFAVELASTLDAASKEMTENYYYFFGQVADVPTADYCNFNLSDGTNSILVYGLYAQNGTDRFGTKRQIAEIPFTQGDYLFVKAKVQNYNGKYELVNAQLVSVGLDAAKAIELCGQLDADSKETSAEEYYIFGQVIDVPTADYCNFNFSDGTNNIIVYGLYAKNETDRYGTKRQIAEIPFTQGDWVLLKGKLQNYAGKLEVVSASLQSVGYCATSAANMASALDGASKETSESAYYFYGTVGEIYNTDYCNFYLTDATTSDVVVYGLYAPNGTDRYGAKRQIAEIPFKQGDSIIIYANVQNYNGTYELVNAVLVSYIPATSGNEEHIHAHEAEVTAPTCLAGGYTTYTCACGDTYTADETPATGHNYVDGVCQNGCGIAEEHVHAHEAEVTAPTCTAAGYTTYTCACGDTYTEAGEAATGHADENGDYKCDNNCGTVLEPEADSALTIAQAIALAKALGVGEYNVGKYSTNKYYMTVEIVDVYNAQYGNLHVKDASDTTGTYVVYGLYQGSTRYDALANKPVKGDEITIYAAVGSYQYSETSSVSYQMKNAQIDEIVAHTHEYTSEVTASTCTKEGYTTHTCSICEGSYKDSETPALGHTTASGVCERCGQTIGTGIVNYETFTADFNTVANTNSSYVKSTTTDGWVATNCAVMGGGTSDSNPKFKVFGDASTRAFTMNGKTSAKGSIVSSTLSGGISAISFNYTNCFSESNGVDITITIKQNGTVVATKKLDNNSVTKLTAYTFEWDLLDEGVAVKGDFTIEITNNSPSNSTSNKDRVSIWNLQWTNNPDA